MHNAHAHFRGAKFFQIGENGFKRALHVGFHDQIELRDSAGRHALEYILHIDRFRPALAFACIFVCLGSDARFLLACGYVKQVAGMRNLREAQH